jgi:signal transduction histidine kinase
VVCCIGASLLFFLTVGAPLVKDAHRLIRKQVAYVAGQAQALLARDPSRQELAGFARNVAETHEVSVVLLDAGQQPIAAFPADAAASARITPEMAQAVAAEGHFIQPGHFSGRTVYLLPLDTGSGRRHYLYIARPSAALRPFIIFLLGLGMLCVLLILAIYPLARSLTRPLSRLSKGLEQIAAGDFREVLPPESRDDELGRLEDTFRRMSLSINEMIASKKQLLADISHELRSPLGRMEASLELLSEAGGHAGRQQKHIRTMSSEIAFMTGLVRALSAYAKINLPGYSPDRTATFPEVLLDDLFDRNEALLSKQGIRFRKSIEKDLPPLALDPSRMFQVLQNFLDNARRHCPEGGEVLLGAARVGDRTRFFVADTGKGVPPELREKIFEPLFRVDRSRSLAICRKIVELHGGRIQYHREDGRTVFSFELANGSAPFQLPDRKSIE